MAQFTFAVSRNYGPCGVVNLSEPSLEIRRRGYVLLRKEKGFGSIAG
jgi:hypothetical protein